MSSLNICFAAYNEGKTIKSTLDYLETSLDQIKFKEKPKILICVNGCTDNTQKVLKEIQKEYNYPLKILKSKKGKLNAHKKLINSINTKNPILFLDADILVPSKTIIDLLNELNKNKKLKVVCAYPYALKPKNLSFIKNIKYSIINLKRIYPKIEISKEDVSEFHKPNIKDPFLKRSRIYFHGRCFLIPNKIIYKFPKKNTSIRGDDTYLSFSILKEQPKGSIKVLYDSQVFSYPIFSFKEYLNVWYRIRKDLDNIYTENPEFKKIGKKTEMTLNWKYLIYELPIEFKLYGFGFYLLKSFEKISYNLIKKKVNIDKIWSWEDKTTERTK